MTERTRKTMVFGLLIAACIWGYANLSGRKTNHPAPPAEASTGEMADPGGAADPLGSATRPAEHVSDEVAAAYDAKPWGKNPFYRGQQPTAASPLIQETPAALHLLGILYRDVGAQALISGRIVAVGDTVLGYKITAITPDYVAVDNGVTNMKLRVKKEST